MRREYTPDVISNDIEGYGPSGLLIIVPSLYGKGTPRRAGQEVGSDTLLLGKPNLAPYGVCCYKTYVLRQDMGLLNSPVFLWLLG